MLKKILITIFLSLLILCAIFDMINHALYIDYMVESIKTWNNSGMAIGFYEKFVNDNIRSIIINSILIFMNVGTIICFIVLIIKKWKNEIIESYEDYKQRRLLAKEKKKKSTIERLEKKLNQIKKY